MVVVAIYRRSPLVQPGQCCRLSTLASARLPQIAAGSGRIIDGGRHVGSRGLTVAAVRHAGLARTFPGTSPMGCAVLASLPPLDGNRRVVLS